MNVDSLCGMLLPYVYINTRFGFSVVCQYVYINKNPTLSMILGNTF